MICDISLGRSSAFPRGGHPKQSVNREGSNAQLPNPILSYIQEEDGLRLHMDMKWNRVLKTKTDYVLYMV